MKQSAKIQKSGAIGLISPLDANDYEQQPNAWTRIENARMRNGGVESILGKVVVDDQVVNISELSYMNNQNGLFHVLFGDGIVGTIREDGNYTDISHTNLEPERVDNPNFDTDLTDWTSSANVSWDTGAALFSTYDVVLVDNPEIETTNDPWVIVEKIRQIGDSYYFSPAPSLRSGNYSIQFYPAGHTVSPLEHYFEQTLKTTPGPVAGLTLVMSAWELSEGDFAPYEFDWRIELIDSLDAVIASEQVTVADSGEYQTRQLTVNIGNGDSFTDIQKVRIGVIGREEDGLRLQAGVSAVYVYEYGVVDVQATLTQDLISVVDGTDYQLTYVISALDVIDAGEEPPTLAMGSQSFDITADGTFSVPVVGEASNLMAITSNPSSVGFRLESVSVKAGEFLPNTYPENVWIWTKLHGVLAATNGVSDPVFLPADATPSTRIADLENWGKYYASDVPNENDNDVCQCIAAFREFLFAGNITAGLENPLREAGREYPSVLRWSDKADPGEPPPNWYSAEPTSLANEVDVGDEIGAILAMKTLRDDLIIYGELGTKRCQYTGIAPYGFRITPMYPKTGIYGPRCVVEHRTLHYLMTQDDIVVNNGQAIETIADQRVRKDIFSKARQKERNSVYLAMIAEKGELWVCINVDDNVGADEAWVYSVEEQTWSKRSLDGEYVIRELPKLDEVVDTEIGHLTYTQIAEQNNNVLPPDTPTDATTGLGTDMYSGVGDAPYSTKIAALGDAEAYSGNANTYARQDAGDPVEVLLERRSLNITDDEHDSMITAIYPRMTGNCSIEVGGLKTVDGTVNWKPAKDFDSSSDYRINTKCRGRRHSVRFKGTELRLEGFDIEWAPAGKR